MQSTVSRKQFVQNRREAGMWVDEAFSKHKLVRIVERQQRIRRKDVRDRNGSRATDAGPTVHQNLCPFTIYRSQPVHGLRHQMALDGIVCTVAHCDLPVDDRFRLTVVAAAVRFGRRRRVDHVEVVGYVQDVREAELGGVRCCDEITEVNTADDVIVVGTLASQVQRKINTR